MHRSFPNKMLDVFCFLFFFFFKDVQNLALCEDSVIHNALVRKAVFLKSQTRK